MQVSDYYKDLLIKTKELFDIYYILKVIKIFDWIYQKIALKSSSFYPLLGHNKQTEKFDLPHSFLSFHL